MAVSEMMTDEIESVREALANEKEERIKAELDAQEVCNLTLPNTILTLVHRVKSYHMALMLP